jgi:hypothetical protein
MSVDKFTKLSLSPHRDFLYNHLKSANIEVFIYVIGLCFLVVYVFVPLGFLKWDFCDFQFFPRILKRKEKLMHGL